MSDADDAKAIIEEYVAACNAGSAERLRAIFHENALMSGYMMGEYHYGSRQNLFSRRWRIRHRKHRQLPVTTLPIFTTVEVSGPVASVTLKEAGFMGMNFTDYFPPGKNVDGDWKIISKTFNPE